jgi:hypothetical protein
VRLAFINPFTKKRVDIRAPREKFLKEYGFSPKPAPTAAPENKAAAGQ